MKKLTLRTNEESFLTIMKSKQKVKHRYVHPNSQKKYVKSKCDGKVHDSQDDIPDGELNIEVLPVRYDVLYLTNGGHRDAPRLAIEIERVKFIIFTDRNSNDIVCEESGTEYVGCQI